MKNFDPAISNCKFCNSSEIIHYKTDFKGIQIFKCKNCSIQFMNPVYTDQYLNDFYSNYFSDSSDKRQMWLEPIQECHNFYISLVEKYAPKDKFLSVGCGEAVELTIAKQRGWHPEGYDVDANLTAQLSQKLGIPISSGDFLQYDAPLNSFNGIYLHQVLEHPKNPEAYLQKIYSLLSDEGVVFIACPNIDSFSHRFKTLLEKLKLKKNVAKHYDTWHHLFYYNPYVLKAVMEKYFNFKVKLIRNAYHVRPEQSAFKRFMLKNILEVFPYKSSFVLIAGKKK